MIRDGLFNIGCIGQFINNQKYWEKSKYLWSVVIVSLCNNIRFSSRMMRLFWSTKHNRFDLFRDSANNMFISIMITVGLVFGTIKYRLIQKISIMSFLNEKWNCCCFFIQIYVHILNASVFCQKKIKTIVKASTTTIPWQKAKAIMISGLTRKGNQACYDIQK